jgi:hypothetical protein
VAERHDRFSFAGEEEACASSKAYARSGSPESAAKESEKVRSGPVAWFNEASAGSPEPASVQLHEAAGIGERDVPCRAIGRRDARPRRRRATRSAWVGGTCDRHRERAKRHENARTMNHRRTLRARLRPLAGVAA